MFYDLISDVLFEAAKRETFHLQTASSEQCTKLFRESYVYNSLLFLGAGERHKANCHKHAALFHLSPLPLLENEHGPAYVQSC